MKLKQILKATQTWNSHLQNPSRNRMVSQSVLEWLICPLCFFRWNIHYALGNWHCSLMTFKQYQFFAKYETEKILNLGHAYLIKPFGHLQQIGRCWESFFFRSQKKWQYYNYLILYLVIKIKSNWTRRWNWSEREKKKIVACTVVN